MNDTYPEPYAIEMIGLERYVEAYRLYPQPRTPELEAHASAMAWKLQGADPLASLAVVFRSTCWIPCWMRWKFRKKLPLRDARDYFGRPNYSISIPIASPKLRGTALLSGDL